MKLFNGLGCSEREACEFDVFGGDVAFRKRGEGKLRCKSSAFRGLSR